MNDPIPIKRLDMVTHAMSQKAVWNAIHSAQFDLAKVIRYGEFHGI